ETAGQLRLGARGKCGDFLMPDVDPFHFLAVMNGVDNAVQRVSNDTIDSANACNRESFDNMLRYRSHFVLPLPPPERFVVIFLCFFAGGSPVEAFATSPPSSPAISTRSLLLVTDRGSSTVTSRLAAKRSRCLISSQELRALLPNPLVRT